VENSIISATHAIVFLPLIGAILAGFFGQKMGRTLTHRVTVTLLGISFFLSLWVANAIISSGETFNTVLYHWVSIGLSKPVSFDIGFLIDPLSVVMMATVTFVSFLVHIYSIGYMHDDDGYQRFFSYISYNYFLVGKAWVYCHIFSSVSGLNAKVLCKEA